MVVRLYSGESAQARPKRRHARSLRKALLLLIVFWIQAAAPGAHLEPKDSVEQYPHACRFDDGAVGVDYLRRSLPTPRGIQVIPGTLIFDIGAYPRPEHSLKFELSDFSLDWKKADRAQGPVHPQYVVASLMRPEFSRSDRGLTIGAGRVDPRTGDYDGIQIGGPPRNPRFPGDPRGTGQRPPTIPVEPRAGNHQPHPDELPSRIIPLHALPSSPIEHPAAGYIYFAYNGKLSKLHRLTLSIRSGGETCELLIRE